MSYRLSLLDKAPVPEGSNATETFANAVALALRAEQLGYHRYWFAEHHGVPGFASSAPEAAAAFVLGKTSRIRVGTGGVMLQHYAPYKVAEVFNVLSALAPGRVDLGIGRAPGGLPLSTRALRRAGGEGPALDFDAKFIELSDILSNTLPAEHPLAGLAATPSPSVGAERILFGASVESAELAARHDWLFCYAGHFDGDPARIQLTFDAYRKISKRAPQLAVVAFVADSAESARRQVGELKLYRTRLSTGQTVNLPSREAAAEYARQAGVSEYSAEEIRPSVLAGTGAQVRAELDRLHAQFGVGEFIIDTPVADFAARHASVEGLAAAERAVAA